MNVITLAGKQFKQCTNSTLEHDIVTMNYVRAAGLHELVLREDENHYDFVANLIHRLSSSGYLFKLLGCMLIPAFLDGKDWSPAVAEETENFLRKLTDDEDKRIVQEQIVLMLTSFFRAGLVTVKTTQSSSSAGL